MRKIFAILIMVIVLALLGSAYTSELTEKNNEFFEETGFFNTLPSDLSPLILQHNNFSDLLNLRLVSKNTDKDVMTFLRKGRSLGYDLPFPCVVEELQYVKGMFISNYYNFGSDMGLLILKATKDLIQNAVALDKNLDFSGFNRFRFISKNTELIIENIISNFDLSPEIVKLTIKSLNLMSLSHNSDLYNLFLRSMKEFINLDTLLLTLSQLESIRFNPKMRLENIRVEIDVTPTNRQFWDFLNFNQTKKLSLIGNPQDLLQLIRIGQFLGKIEELEFYDPSDSCELDTFYAINTIFPSLKKIQLCNFYYSNLIKSLPTNTNRVSVGIASDALIDDLVNLPETVQEFQIIQSLSPTKKRNNEEVIRDIANHFYFF